MGTRLFAFVHAQLLHRRVRQSVGLPLELTEGPEDTEELPWPHVLILQEESPGNVFLYRMTRNGDACGDTWHRSVEDAKHQASYEYLETIGEWQQVPHDVGDAREFAVAAVRSSVAGGS